MTKPVSRKLAVDCLLGLYRIVCGICGEQLFPGDDVQFDHIHSDVMGGPHEHSNLRPVHYDPCHKKKTARDIAANCKVKRILNPKPSKRPMKSGGRKIPSRPFLKLVKP